jgi:hypothetical protein
VFFSFYSDIAQYVFSGKTGHLTNLQKSNACVLKDTLAEFLDVFLRPLRMGELQVALCNAPVTCIEDVCENTQKSSSISNVLLRYTCDESSEPVGRALSFLRSPVFLLFYIQSHRYPGPL